MVAPKAGPFYFKLVPDTDVTFDAETHAAMDWYVFEARILLQEGEKPRLTIVVENPGGGLLALENKWCWWAYDKSPGQDGSQITPQFFGRLVGVPSDMDKEAITVQFITWPKDYNFQLQRLAESLKRAPWYDAIWFDVAHRDDPMKVFETYNAMVCTDPVTMQLTAEDIIDASDGNVDVTEEEHFYDSLNVSPGATPKSAIHVDASISWTQTARGYVDLGGFSFQTYSGDGILNDWPKPLTALAPGLTAFVSSVWDTNNVNSAVTTSWSSSWVNKEKSHSDGDQLSLNISQTRPQFAASQDQGYIINLKYQPGFLDPFATDGDGDRSPTNIPMSYQSNSVWAGSYSIGTALIVEYNVERPHTERIIFTLFADTQSTTLDPLVTEDSETITLSSADVGIPLIDMLNWSSVAGQHVEAGTLIFPNDPLLPGGQSAQYALNSGTAGIVPPDFSDVPGEEIVDGDVTWVSIGTATPPENAPDWAGSASVNAGTVICPRRPIFVDYAVFVKAGEKQFPPVPTPISEGTVLRLANGHYSVCTIGGQIGAGFNTATMVDIGTRLPSGTTFFIAKTGGRTGPRYVIPQFDETRYAVTTDNEVQWICIDTGIIPVGGQPGNVTGFTYVGSDRGQNVTIPHLLLRARARLRYTNRCVMVKFTVDYVKGMSMSLRKTATLHDRRLPDGVVAGKITSLEYVASGGEFVCNVVIMCCVGKDTVIEAVTGSPTYIVDDYIDPTYYRHEGSTVLLEETSDVGFTPVVAIPDDDGIYFPLTERMFVVSKGVKIVGSQSGAIKAAFDSMKKAQELAIFTWDVNKLQQAALANANGLGAQLLKNPKWVEYEFKPMNASFNRVYHVKPTVLSLPRQANLEGSEITS